MKISSLAVGITLWLCAAAFPGQVLAANADDWKFGASIYGWFPDLKGRSQLSDANDGTEIQIDIRDILKNLEFTFMGTLGVRKGRFGAFTDVIYMSVGKSGATTRDGTVGGSQIPTEASLDAEFDMKSWVWTTAGYYRLVDGESSSLDILAGFRRIDVKQSLDWRLTGNVGPIPIPDREGRAKGKLDNWDFIAGARGRLGLGGNWYLPAYLDLGAGESNFTLQAATGVGYALGWGEITAVWRYLEYEFDSDSVIADLSFNGPALGVAFRW
jgi:hypothetical protein